MRRRTKARQLFKPGHRIVHCKCIFSFQKFNVIVQSLLWGGLACMPTSREYHPRFKSSTIFTVALKYKMKKVNNERRQCGNNVNSIKIYL